MINQKYIIAFIAVILIFAYVKISNPYREYGTEEFWQTANLASVYEIPEKALLPGNKNGPVLMWAAIAADDPQILKALVERGALINESDGVFKGTPLTGAAGYSKYPEMIDELIRLGADIHKKVHHHENALMVAARYNNNPGIASALIKHGASIDQKNDSGQTARDIAIKATNKTFLNELERFSFDIK